ncbi:MAG: N-acetyltransferase [Acidimicrobiales bacterium]|nr:N-acetyltransferase [Acidimicrobiales bacterium]
MFPPIHTDRLVIRAFEPADLGTFHSRRNDPRVARWQDWEFPFPMERAREAIHSIIALGKPTVGEWWNATVTLPDGPPVGDLGVSLSWEGRTAEVGYSFDPEHWGQGYATEALSALVAYLFDDLDVTRVFGMLDPANVASARLLERTGFLYEGRTKSSYWKAGEVSDDVIYGMTRSDWEEWVDRPRDLPEKVELVEVTEHNFADVARLRTHHTQESFVAPMLWSFADALFPGEEDGLPVIPWMRAVEADGVLAGFVMVAVENEKQPDAYLWRLLVDRLQQRRGLGKRIMELLIDECRQRGVPGILTSWVEGAGSPRPFYESLGFVATGNIVESETEARLDLA